MKRMNALSAALSSAALSLWTLPALALAQASQPGSAPAPMDRPASAGGPASTNWLWIIAAIVVLAIVWWAVSSRRGTGATRT